MERFIQVCTLHHYLPLFLPSWADAAVGRCLLDPQLEDPAAGALQPSCPRPGNLLLVSSRSGRLTFSFASSLATETVVTLGVCVN